MTRPVPRLPRDPVPADLPVMVNLSTVPDARPWLESLPSLIGAVAAEFGLRLGPPVHGGSCSWVAPARLPDGTPVMVKIGWPHREMYGEAAALRVWDGNGAVRLLRHSPERHAMVLQRCVPGGRLGEAALPVADRIRAGCAVLRRLWAAPLPEAGELETLTAVAAEWADIVDERVVRLRPGYDPGLVELGASLLRTLPHSADRTVVLHGDFNPGNVLSAAGQGWLAIDPKPMVGDPAYDPWPLLEQITGGGLPFADRLELAGETLGCAPSRIAMWSLARTVNDAFWYASLGDMALGAEAMKVAREQADLLGRLQ